MTEVQPTITTLSMPRADRRRGKKRIAKLADYDKTGFLPQSRLMEPIVGSERMLRDPKNPSKGTRAFTVRELEDRAIERMRARGAIPLHIQDPRFFQFRRPSKRANPLRRKQRDLAQARFYHGIAMNLAIGINPIYIGGLGDISIRVQQWKAKQRAWLKDNPVPTGMDS